MDIERLSDMLNEKKESSGLNPLEVIKQLREMATEIKQLQQVIPKQQQPQQIQSLPNEPAKPQPKPQIQPEATNRFDKRKGFDMIIKALRMAVNIYGDLPASQFIDKLEQDKEKILKFVKL